MTLHRRQLLQAAGAAGALALAGPRALAQASSTSLKISHQFPGGTLTEGDFRDRLCRKFAAEVEKRTGGALKAAVYPGGSLMKTNAQFSALRKGALDLSLVPLSYAGGEVPETNLGLMPALVPSYQQAALWKTAEVGKQLARVLDARGVLIVSWVWQAGGVACRTRAVVGPEDAKGLKIRGGSREMDLMLKQAGASVISLPSNEIYAAMQTGAMDAAMTSSTSFVSFKLEEIAKYLTSGRVQTYWFMLEPLLISKAVFAGLPRAQQEVVMGVGDELEGFARSAAAVDDITCAEIYRKAGAKLFDIDAPTLKRWQAIARETAWKDFAERNASCADLLKAAQKLL